MDKSRTSGHRQYFLRWFVVLAIVLLAGCRGVPEREDESSSWLDDRQAFFKSYPNWQASGRMAIKDGDRGISVNFDWINQGDRFELRLRTSGGRWVMLVQPGYAELEGTRIGRLEASSAEPLTEQALGWPVPVSLLKSWMRALPAPEGARLRFANDGSVLGISHEDWRISYQKYAQFTPEMNTETQWQTGLQQDVLLPTRLDATKGQYAIKVLISDWTL